MINRQHRAFEVVGIKEGPEVKEAIIEHELRKAGKKLAEPDVRPLLSAEKTSNPLFLHTILDELRHTASFETLRQKVCTAVECRQLRCPSKAPFRSCNTWHSPR